MFDYNWILGKYRDLLVGRGNDGLELGDDTYAVLHPGTGDLFWIRLDADGSIGSSGDFDRSAWYQLGHWEGESGMEAVSRVENPRFRRLSEDLSAL